MPKEKQEMRRNSVANAGELTKRRSVDSNKVRSKMRYVPTCFNNLIFLKLTPDMRKELRDDAV